MEDIVYRASTTLKRFHKDDHFVRGVIGPIGSGKSVAMCWEIFLKICKQSAHNGVRKSRWIVIRNTYRELVDTTMQTWFDWFPKHLGAYKSSDMTFTWKFPLDDGTMVHLELFFRALDKPGDIKKLLSLELTGGWINEARETPKPIMDMLIGRVGRFPGPLQGGVSWYGVIMDTNPCDEDHWWYRVFEEDTPKLFKGFSQPSGLSDTAENLNWLTQTAETLQLELDHPDRLAKGREYYHRLSAGKDQEWINVYVHGKYGFVQEGRVIFPEYNDQLHCVHDLGLHESTKLVYLGADFGLTPACVVAQISPIDGQIQCLDEVVTEDMGAVRFGRRIKDLINLHYDRLPINGWGDPAGDTRVDTDEQTPFLVMSAAGVPLSPAPTNDPVIRRESVAMLLTTLTMTGRPQLVISPKCRMLRKALAGGYKYRKMNVVGSERFAEKPDKNMYSHVADALQYLCVGMGHGYELTKSRHNLRSLPPVALDRNYDPLQANHPRRYRQHN